MKPQLWRRMPGHCLSIAAKPTLCTKAIHCGGFAIARVTLPGHCVRPKSRARLLPLICRRCPARSESRATGIVRFRAGRLNIISPAASLAVANRLPNFQRVFDLPSRILSPDILAVEIDEQSAQRELIRRAANALGVATVQDMADYYRMTARDTQPSVDALVKCGDLTPVSVSGWSEQAYLSNNARLPREISGQSLLSPFDPVVWFRPRALRLFDFHYRIEIYVPAAKRKMGLLRAAVQAGGRHCRTRRCEGRSPEFDIAGAGGSRGAWLQTSNQCYGVGAGIAGFAALARPGDYPGDATQPDLAEACQYRSWLNCRIGHLLCMLRVRERGDKQAMYRIFSVLTATMVLAACGTDQEQATAPVSAAPVAADAAASLDPAKGIDWFEWQR